MSGADGAEPPTNSDSRTPRNSKGWDGKLRVGQRAVLANPEAVSDAEHSDDDAPPVEQIEADEGMWRVLSLTRTLFIQMLIGGFGRQIY